MNLSILHTPFLFILAWGLECIVVFAQPAQVATTPPLVHQYHVRAHHPLGNRIRAMREGRTRQFQHTHQRYWANRLQNARSGGRWGANPFEWLGQWAAATPPPPQASN